MKAVAASSTDDLNDCAIVAALKLCTTRRKRNLDEKYINEADQIVRGYIPRSRNMFSVTKRKALLVEPPRLPMAKEVGIGTDGKIDAASTGLGTVSLLKRPVGIPTTLSRLARLKLRRQPLLALVANLILKRRRKAMADMKDIVKVAVDAYHGNVEQYSIGQSMELLHKALVDANGGSTGKL